MFAIPSLLSRLANTIGGQSPPPTPTTTPSISGISPTTTSVQSRCSPSNYEHSRAVVNKIMIDRSPDDLVSSSNGRRIGQPTLLRHFPLPGILGDRFFDVIRTRSSASSSAAAAAAATPRSTAESTSTPSSPSPSSPFSVLRSAIKGGPQTTKELSISEGSLLATVVLFSWGSLYERRCFLFDMFDCSGSGRISKAELEGILVSGALRPSVGDGCGSSSTGSTGSTGSTSTTSSRFVAKEEQLMTSEESVHIARLMAEDAFECHGEFVGSFGLDAFCRWLDSTPEVEHLLLALLSPDFMRRMVTLKPKSAF